MLHPGGGKKKFFDIIIGLFIIFSVFWVPVDMAFNVATAFGMAITNWVVNFFFFMDMMLSFRTVYFSNKNDSFVAIPSKVKYITNI